MRQGTVLLKDYTLDWKESSRLHGRLLVALCQLEIENPKSVEDGFTPIEIVEAVSLIDKRWAGINDSTECSKRVRNCWKQLLTLWEAKKPGIYQYLKDNGMTALPELRKTEGGGSGNPSRYYIEWSEQASSSESQQLAQSAYESFNIKYVCEDISNPGLLARAFSKGLNVSGWRRYLFATWISVPIVMGVLGIFILLAQIQMWDHFGIEQIFRTFISISLFLLAIWMTAWSFIKLPDNRIVVAPLWLQSEFNDRLIELIKQPERTIKAVHYSSKCPICQGKVNAMSGKWEFRGRIVGRCENAPIEHVFSFDHVTRSGRSLRN